MTFNAEKLRAPHFIFIIYVLASALLIMIFRFILPGSEPPLPIYSFNWRLLRGVLDLFDLLPALFFSALVVPFGMASFEENYQSFSDIFFKRLLVSVITAICAAVVYGIIFFLVLPVLKNYDENLRFSGELYLLAKENAKNRSASGNWQEASQYLAICDNIWYNNPDLKALKEDIEKNIVKPQSDENKEKNEARKANAGEWQGADITPLSEKEPPINSAQEAIVKYEAAFSNGDYFDAHWLATIAGRLAIEGSPEQATAARLAGEAWNKISSQDPNQTQIESYQQHNLKVSGYQAMNSKDYIRAYYIFRDLESQTPNDPDVKNFLAKCGQGALEHAFFLDEIEVSTREILTGAVFSLPSGSGRAVLRFLNLTTSEDVAYAMDIEYMEIDINSNLTASVSAPYAKLLPFNNDGKMQVLVLMHVLDRYNKDNSHEGQWLVGEKKVGGIFLDISYEDLLLLTNVRRGLSNLQINELFAASGKVENLGYVHQIFQAEIISRIGTVLFFLPMSIFMIIFGWRYRAKTKPRYLFVLLLPVMPIVFHCFVFMYRSFINILGIWLVLSFSFTIALVVLIAAIGLLLFFSLIMLSAQHS